MSEEVIMYRKYVLAGALIVAFAAPAFAAEFYVNSERSGQEVFRCRG